MDVRLQPPGCVGRLGAVLSLGLLPLVQRSHFRQFPASLDDAGVRLRNGTFIPWHTVTRFTTTDLLVQGMHANTQYELWHAGGRVRFTARQIEDPEGVAAFIARRVPPAPA